MRSSYPLVVVHDPPQRRRMNRGREDVTYRRPLAVSGRGRWFSVCVYWMIFWTDESED